MIDSWVSGRPGRSGVGTPSVKSWDYVIWRRSAVDNFEAVVLPAPLAARGVLAGGTMGVGVALVVFVVSPAVERGASALILERAAAFALVIVVAPGVPPVVVGGFILAAIISHALSIVVAVPAVVGPAVCRRTVVVVVSLLMLPWYTFALSRGRAPLASRLAHLLFIFFNI